MVKRRYAIRYNIPTHYFVYEFSYPEEMPELAGIIFYIGKGTTLSRMDAHFREAANGCVYSKCSAIRSVWDAGLVVVRRIVFESRNEEATLNEERKRILQHSSPYLTNLIQTEAIYTKLTPRQSKSLDKRFYRPGQVIYGDVHRDW